MPTFDARGVCARAVAEIGTPFRQFGRIPGAALDCVGLTLVAIGGDDQGWKYSLKGNYADLISAYLEKSGFLQVSGRESPQAGDIALVQCSSQNQHLMIRSVGGWVHAHAGLGRVVHLPGDNPWPLIALWRSAGE
jgi:hypothetical protein